MNYKEARENCNGCEFAFATVIEDLPLSQPDPNQDAVITCRAPVNLIISPNSVGYSPSGKEVNVYASWTPAFGRCQLSPTPDQEDCSVFNESKHKINGRVTIPKSQFESGKINLDDIKWKQRKS